MPLTLRPLAQTPTFCVVQHDNFVLLWWKDTPSAAAAPSLRSAFARAKATGRKVVFLTYLDDKALSGSIPADIRKELSALLADHDKDVGAACIVYERTGLKGAILRGVVTAIRMASKASFPSEVKADLSDALGWIIKAAGEAVLSPSELLSAIRELQGQPGPTRAAG